MSKRRGTVDKAIEQGFKRRGVPHERADLIYQLLLADGPLDSHQIADHLGVPVYQVTGSTGGIEHLLADGRAFSVKGRGPNRMYYARDEDDDDDEVPCACTGLVHKDTCPNWRLPL